ncbi:hypothetical protein HYY70_00070 [Candidatus Woesearchaeota archaeon]|nr:hypothetical protein [Candidatus Woesearchaeota archaeon]
MDEIIQGLLSRVFDRILQKPDETLKGFASGEIRRVRTSDKISLQELVWLSASRYFEQRANELGITQLEAQTLRWYFGGSQQYAEDRQAFAERFPYILWDITG